MIGRALRKRRPQVVPDVSKDPTIPTCRALRMVIRLLDAGEAVGPSISDEDARVRSIWMRSRWGDPGRVLVVALRNARLSRTGAGGTEGAHVLVPSMMVVALAGQADPTTAARVKETAYARVARAQTIARDSAIHSAVSASNALVEPPDLIRRRDAVWIAIPRDPLRQAIVQAPCSAKVREMVKDDPLVVEAFVMSDRGTLVCSMARPATTDGATGEVAADVRGRQGRLRRARPTPAPGNTRSGERARP